jgi:hypothetical protein
MIVAIEGLIPDRRAVSPREKISPCTRPANLCLRMAAGAAGHNLCHNE